MELEIEGALFYLAGAVSGVLMMLVLIGFEFYRRGGDDDRYKEVAQEVAMGARQAYVALGTGPQSGRYVEVIRVAHAILDPLMVKARSITGPDYEHFPRSLWVEAESGEIARRRPGEELVDIDDDGNIVRRPQDSQ